MNKFGSPGKVEKVVVAPVSSKPVVEEVKAIQVNGPQIVEI